MTSRSHVMLAGAAVATLAAVWLVREYMATGDAAQPVGGADKPVLKRTDLPTPSAVGLPASASTGAASAVAAGRFLLAGVLTNGSESRALISVDGKPARALRLGETVDGEIVVQQVSADGATLGPRDGRAALTLQVSPAPVSSVTNVAPIQAPSGPEVKMAPSDGTPARPQALSSNNLSKFGPLPQASAPPAPVETTPPSVDDGRWRPAIGQ